MSHTGETRAKMEKIRKLKRPWTCGFCRLGVEPDRPQSCNGPPPGQCMAAKCRNRKIRRGDDFLACTECLGQLHKQRKCSNMTTGEISNIDRTIWKCEGCLGVMAGEQVSEETTAPTFKVNSSNFTSRLTILQWNCDHLLAKVEELRSYLERREIDIFFIQETKLISNDKGVEAKFPGYTIKRRDRLQPMGKEGNRGGGLLIGIKKGIPFRVANIDLRGREDGITESLSIEIPLRNGQKIRFTNVYIPPIRNTSAEAERRRGSEVTTDKWPCERYDCLFGDFNAHAPVWDCTSEEADQRGEIVDDWIRGTGMMSLNDPEFPTRTDRSSNDNNRRVKDTSPDISIVHSSMADRFTFWKTETELGSDHLPIVMRYEEPDSIPAVDGRQQYRWKLKDAKWADFTADVERRIPQNYQAKSVRKIERLLRRAIITSANKFVRKKRVNNNTKPHMTEELRKAIKERNRLRSTRAANRKEWAVAAKRVVELVRETRAQKWKEYVGTLDMSTNPAQVWRTIHSLEGKYPAKSENEVLTFEGEALVDDSSKAKAFAKTYKGFSKLPMRREDRPIRKSVRRRLKENCQPLEGPDEPEGDITMHELDRAIEEAGLGKAAGEDDIPYEMVKHLGKKARLMLLHIYNRCWAGEELPATWRTALIKTLLKEGKDPKDTASYRPISLTSCMGKLLEKIVADRLTYSMESKGLISDDQAGFRQNRCTTDQVLKMTQSAADQMQDKKGHNAIVVAFFDYAKAYDKVWRDGLLYKMLEMGLPHRFVRYVRNFLSTRRTKVDINGTRSDTFMLNEGLPQGSSISPLLFLIFINDIGSDLHDLTIASLFADDTSIWMPGGTKNEEAVRDMQAEVDKIMAWAKKWKMTINVDKTRAMVISSNVAETKTDPELVADGECIKLVQAYRFLGVTVDSGLRFTDHINQVIEKSRKRVQILKCMAWKDWGNTVEVQRTLYVQYCRMVLEFSSSAFTPLLEKTNLERLERVQNEALRAITRMYKTCPRDFLRLEANVEPLSERFRKNDEILYDKYLRLPPSDARRKLVEKVAPKRLTGRFGWRPETIDRINLDLPREERTAPLAPWRVLTQLNVEYVELERKKSEYRPEELKQLTLEKIETYDPDFYIFTDGSTDGKQENGGAGMYIEDRWNEVVAEKSFPAGVLCSSYTGECVAMLEAIKWTQEMQSEMDTLKVLICTDSRSLADALNRNHWKDDDPWLKQIKDLVYGLRAEVTLLWIPSHCDTDGNEKADELAKLGTEMDQSSTPVSHKIVKAKIKNRKWTITHDRAIATYGDRRSPRLDIEKQWPVEVRTLYCRLRSDHAVELKRYRCDFLHTEDDALCEMECGEVEDIEHVLCRCICTLAARIRLYPGEVNIRMLTTDPDTCRKILMTKFRQLRLPHEKPPPQAHQPGVVRRREDGLVGTQTVGGSPRRALAHSCVTAP